MGAVVLITISNLWLLYLLIYLDSVKPASRAISIKQKPVFKKKASILYPSRNLNVNCTGQAPTCIWRKLCPSLQCLLNTDLTVSTAGGNFNQCTCLCKVVMVFIYLTVDSSYVSFCRFKVDTVWSVQMRDQPEPVLFTHVVWCLSLDTTRGNAEGR